MDVFDKYNFHDSLIQHIEYFSSKKKLIIDIELCNWCQSFYTEGEPEIKKGKLIFLDVSFFKFIPSTVKINDNEILEIHKKKDNIIEIVFFNITDVQLLIIKSSNIYWRWET